MSPPSLGGWQDEECFASFASALGLCVWAVLGHGSALHSVWRHQQAMQAVHSLQSHARDTSTLVSLLPVVSHPSTSFSDKEHQQRLSGLKDIDHTHHQTRTARVLLLNRTRLSMYE